MIVISILDIKTKYVIVISNSHYRLDFINYYDCISFRRKHKMHLLDNKKQKIKREEANGKSLLL